MTVEADHAGLSVRIYRRLLWSQGTYYVVTGVWPIVSIETFQWVTGPKTDHLPTGSQADHWLVMTVAVLVVAIGLSLLAALRSTTARLETVVLGMSAAVGLTAIDVLYVARDVLLPIYLADAAIQAALILGWLYLIVRGRNDPFEGRRG